MRFIILTLLIASTTTLSAQNWAPINTTDIYNYKADTASAISHSLWIDSVSFNGTDSIYYPNRIVKHISNSLALKNQPQFLNKQLTITGNGLYLYNDPSNISYYSLANLNDSYTYDSTNSIIATVVSFDTATILGNIDSIKTLALSSGDTIIASKNHGFVQYPMEYGSGKYYRLAGIEGGRTLGEHVPKFDDFFNYSIGDTFWYYNFAAAWNSDNGPESHEKKSAYSIDTLYRVGDTIFYSFPGVVKELVKYNLDLPTNDVNSFPNSLRMLPDEHTANYIDDYHLIWYNAPFLYNYYDNTLATASCSYYPNDPPIDYWGYTPYVSSNGLNGKRYNLFYCGNMAAGDTLNYRRHALNDLIWNYGENNRIFIERIGITEIKMDGFESMGFCKMYAYKLAGDSTITILDQNLFDLVIGIDELEQSTNFKLLGNPITSTINIKLETAEAHTLTLYNLNGQMLLQQQTQDTQVSMDVSDLPQGIYLLEISNASGVSRERVVKL